VSVIVECGRARSYLELQELSGLWDDDVNDLSPHEVALLLDLIKAQNPGDLKALRAPVYSREMVGIDEFLDNEYYLGHIGKTLYPKLRDDLVQLFEGGDYHEAILSGSIGLDAIIQEADGGLPTLRERIGVSSDVLVLQECGLEVSTTEPGHRSGVKDVLRVTLANGMRLDLTPAHEVRVYRGGPVWVAADSLTTDDLVLSARWIRTNPTEDLTLEDAALLGYWVADGSSSDTRARFCDGNPATSLEVLNLLRAIGFDGKREKKGNAWEVYVKNVKKSGFLKWLRGYGAWNKTHDATVPDAVCRSGVEVVARFISRVWACKGTVYAPPSKCSPPRFALGMVSERFIRQMQLLLLRFGIRARIREVHYTDKRNGAKRLIWHLVVSGRDQLDRFLESFGNILGKEDACRRIRDYCDHAKGNTNVDTLPLTWGELNDMMVFSGMKREVGSEWWRLGTSRGRRLSRSMLRRWVDGYGDANLGHLFQEMFPGDVCYERVVSVGRVHVAIPVGDIGAHNGNRFIANGISVHNSIGWGKNTLAGCALCYMVYRMSCLKDPQKVFGLEKGSEIAFVCLSVNEQLAKKVVFGSIKSKIMTSRYFMECFPYRQTLTELRFPNNIWVAASSSSMSSALSMNTFGGILDEVNFMPLTPPRVQKIRHGSQKRERQSHAETLYSMLIKRIKSRYMRDGKVPGILLVISSKSHQGAFTEKRIAVARNSPGIFVVEHNLWEVKRHLFSQTTFPVLAGNERIRSTILPGEADAAEARRQIAENKDYESCHVIDVPTDFAPDFRHDIETSLQDLAGIATVGISPFLQRREALFECIDETRSHPMIMEWNPKLSPCIDWDQLVCQHEVLDSKGVPTRIWGPIVNPTAVRHVHIDTSLNKDATGVCIGHVSDWVKVLRRDQDGNLQEEDAPEYHIDLMLRVIPPTGEDIIMADIRSFLYSFMDRGFVFGKLTTDTYQSVEMRQYFQDQRGVATEVLSVDRTMDAYLELRSAIYDARMSMYDYPPFMREMQRVIHDRIRGKIDHLDEECFTGETRIPLLDGTMPMISELAGKEVWVYSCTEDGRPVPGRAKGFVRGAVTSLVDVVLDSGAVSRCTPEHPWMLRNGRYKAAKDLVPLVDRLMPLGRGRAYAGPYELVSGKTGAAGRRETHRMVWEGLRGEIPDGHVVHHIDGDGSNHRVRAVIPVILDEPVLVYDLEVETHHNFALTCGVVVHNSKDVADAVAGVVSSLSTTGDTTPIPMRMGVSFIPGSEGKDTWLRKDLPKGGERPVIEIKSTDDWIVPIKG